MSLHIGGVGVAPVYCCNNTKVLSLRIGGVGVAPVYCCNNVHELAEGINIFCLALLAEHIRQGSEHNHPYDFTGSVIP